MALLGVARVTKYFVAGLTACGVVITPVVYTTMGGDTQNRLPTEWSLGEQVSAGGSSQQLSLSTQKLFKEVEKGQEKTYTFNQVTMKFGDYQLREGDLLVSPEQRGTYYLAKSIDRNTWELDGGERVNHTYLSRKFKGGNNYKSINLKWTSSNGGMLPFWINLSTCSFLVNNKSNIGRQITITCYNKSSKEVRVTTTVKEEDFKKLIN